MINKLLCFIGVHNWKYKERIEYIFLIKNYVCWCECNRCGVIKESGYTITSSLMDKK